MVNFELGKLYYVHWLDHWAAGGWHDPSTPSPISDINCTTIGFCTHNDDNVVHLSATLSGEEPEHLHDYQCTATMGILKNCISNAWEVEFTE